MRKALIAITVLMALAFPTPAHAADQQVTIGLDGKLSSDHVVITQGDKITWKNNDINEHRIYIKTVAITDDILPGQSASYEPLSAGTFAYGFAENEELGTIEVKPAPVTTTTTTTTTTVKPTTTTTAPTTTTAKPTTTTSSTTTTSTSSTTTTTTLVAAPATSGGGSGPGAALLLGLAALVVAVLAGAVYWGWRRSEEPPFEEPPPTSNVPTI